MTKPDLEKLVKQQETEIQRLNQLLESPEKAGEENAKRIKSLTAEIETEQEKSADLTDQLELKEKAKKELEAALEKSKEDLKEYQDLAENSLKALSEAEQDKSAPDDITLKAKDTNGKSVSFSIKAGASLKHKGKKYTTEDLKKNPELVQELFEMGFGLFKLKTD